MHNNRVCNGSNTYEIDPYCHPLTVLCNTEAEAAELLHDKYGGYFNHKPVLKSDGTHKMKEGVIQHQYKCRVGGEANGYHWKCKWRAQVRELPNGQWGVFTNPLNRVHSHTMDEKPIDPLAQHGLHPTVRVIIERHLKVEDHCILRVKPSTLLRRIIDVIEGSRHYERLNYLVSEQSFFEHLKVQIRNYVSRERERYIQKELGCGVSSIRNNDTLSRILSTWELIIPDDYQPKSDYKSAKEIADALGLESTYQMLAYDLSAGSLYDKYKEKAVGRSQSAQNEFEVKMEFAFFIFSASSLFQLMHLALRRVGIRCGSIDGTGGVIRDDSVLIVFGCHSVKLRLDVDKVTSSLRAIAYLHAGGERKYPTVLMLYALRELCWKLFGIELMLDWGISDQAKAFYNSYIRYRNDPTMCDEAYRPDAMPESVGGIVLNNDNHSDDNGEVVSAKLPTPQLDEMPQFCQAVKRLSR